MHSLITGASGFVGRRLSARLQALGHRVSVLPRVWTRVPEADYIFDLAAFGNKYGQQDYVGDIFEANILRFWKLLCATAQMPYKAFVATASSSIYGNKLHPMKETDSFDADTFYAVTKASSALLARAFAKKYDKPIVTAVPFSVYGPGDDPKHFIPTAIGCFKNGRQLQLASGVHDWIYIDDYIDGVLSLVENADKLKGRIVNIGTAIQSTNHEIVGILREIFKKPLKIKKAEKMRPYDSMNWVADNCLLRSLGWRQRVSLEEGLKKCVYENK